MSATTHQILDLVDEGRRIEVESNTAPPGVGRDRKPSG